MLLLSLFSEDLPLNELLSMYKTSEPHFNPAYFKLSSHNEVCVNLIKHIWSQYMIMAKMLGIVYT